MPEMLDLIRMTQQGEIPPPPVATLEEGESVTPRRRGPLACRRLPHSATMAYPAQRRRP
jgi:hypothetical protein